MASFQFIVTLCAVAAILVARVESTCDAIGLETCRNTATKSLLFGAASNSVDLICKALRAYFDCADKAGIADCGVERSDIVALHQGYKLRYDAACGAAQFLMSWPMYITVLALSVKHLYNSAV